MNKQTTTVRTYLLRGAFLLSLAVVIVMPLALGQTSSHGNKPSGATAQMPQDASPATGRPNVAADSALDHVRSQPAGQPQSHPVPLPNQIEGIDCDSAPGIVIHDDGGIENGYSGNPLAGVTEVRFADKFTPSSYPASYSSVCLDFVILPGGPATYPIDVVVFDDDGAGGAPGTLLGELNGQSATTHLFTGGGQPPIWNSYDISSLGINVTSGSVYIGTRYVPPSNNVFTSADESGPVGFAGGYWWNNLDGVWSQTQNAFPGYTANMIRAVESGGGTPTPTPTPSCTPIVVNGSIDSGDPTQVDRLFRSGIPQTCPASTFCATFGDPTPRHYDEYTFTNTTGATQCVTVEPTTECVGTNYIFAAAYLGSFDPNNICTNWIGDSGSSPDPTLPPVPFQVDVDDGQTFVLVASEVTPGAGCPAYTLTISGLCGGGTGNLNLVSAASVKGPFAIDLPLTGPSGVEDRSGGPNKKYTVVMEFDQNIVSVGSASSTCGGVQSIVVDGSHKVRLNLVNVAHGCNGSTITVTADSIADDQGNVLDSASVGLGLLLGDVNADRVVNRLDTNSAQMHKGQKAVQQNFRNDVNADGHITQKDIELIRQQQGTSLP